MPEYAPPISGTGRATPRIVTVRPDLTVLDLASRYHMGAFAFAALLTANSKVDGLPFAGRPPRHLRQMGLGVGDEIVVPDGGLG